MPSQEAAEIEAPADHRSSKKRIRRSQAQRRDQIARAAYQLLGTHGIHGTTVARIADAVGMTAPSLYAHYGNRQEMLIAAMEPVAERVAQWLRISKNPNIAERIREIGQAHSSFMAAELGFVIPVFEFVLAPRDTDLAARFGEQQLAVIKEIAAMVVEGQSQGTIRTDIDPMQVAWQMIILAWSEDIAHLMGLEEYITEGYSHAILELFALNMTASQNRAATTGMEQDGEGLDPRGT